ncbi:MAG TPA: hypothetical protein VKT28_18815 [Puia sp.]|nr:hypothetical protein [Puia sp.]
MLTKTQILFFAICFLISSIACAQDIGNLKTQKPFSANGSVQLRGIYDNISGTSATRVPYSYIFAGNVTFNVYGISMPASFSISEAERSFRQPFNQFGISPHYKWITVHLGYRNINFSPYTLAGYTMYGAGVELTPGKFRFGFMYGRLNRATTLDTTTLSLVPVSFTRKAIAAKIGYGTQNNFIDISFLKGKDDTSSVKVGKNILDSLSVLPAANTVVAISARLTLWKNIFLQGDVGTSLYTRDITSPISLDSVDDALIKKIKSFAIVNGTSELNTAITGAIGYKAKLFTLKLQYQRIDPGFQSMGAYFFNNDLESYSFAPSFHLFKNKLRFNGSIGFQHDNVQHQKEATTKKIIGTAMLSADLTKHFGLDINYTNFSNNQQPQTIRFADSLKIVQTTQNLSISPRYTILGTTVSHTIILSANLMQMNDFNNYFSQNAISRNVNYKQFYCNYTYGFIPAKLSVFVNVSYTDAEAPGTADKNKGATLGFNKSFLKSAFLVSASGGYFFGTQNGSDDNTINASANLQYHFLRKQALNALLFYTNNKPKNISSTPAFTELRGELAYTYSF